LLRTTDERGNIVAAFAQLLPYQLAYAARDSA
jgi:hypothetical protein